MKKKKADKKVKAKAKARIKTTQKRLPPQRGVTAIVPLSEIAKPEMYRGKFTLAPTLFTEKQIMAIIAPTPKHIIKQRPGKGGGNWDYVPGWWFKKKANFVFGFGHDFEIEGERVDGDFITVKGRVSVREPKTGKMIAIKSDYGGASIKYMKGQPHTPNHYLDIANDFKAAATDCFKRCMVQFGFAMDVYGKSESLDAGIAVHDDAPQQPNKPASEAKQEAPIPDKDNPKKEAYDPRPEFECFNCANPITKAEAEFSKKVYKKQLCRDCQRLAKQGQIER